MHGTLPYKPPSHSCSFHGGTPKRRRIALPTPRRSSESPMTRRRTGNYKPSFWDFNYIQSLTTPYTEESYLRKAAELIVQVKMLLLRRQETEAVPRQLELIDDLQRLGICYHFRDQINQILNSIHYEIHRTQEMDLYSTSLAFRLLRQHGFPVSQDVFDCFKNEKGDFGSSIDDDTRGVLQLYEASFLLTEGEESLVLAKDFATKFLQRKVDGENELIDENVLASIRNALELPIHWRIQRPNARWFIQAYERRPQMNPIVLELAKLDFNILQAIHQQELKLVSRWWKESGLSEKLPFARDRVVECFLWTLGGKFQPEYGYSRMMATKVNILITIIDDIFDVYGTWEELQLFNNIIQRWDIGAMDQLPEYMQMCFLTLHNFVNEMAYNVLKEQGILIIQDLRKSWTDLCRAYTQEAKWYATGYTPTLDEYINNAWISISAPLILSHAFFLITNPIDMESLFQCHNLVRCSSMLLRLANDLGTSPYEMERGDVPKSVECYMKESGASREEGREHVKFMIWETWKMMNQELMRVGDSHQFLHNFIISAVDLGRMAQYMYQDGDGHGIQNQPQIKNRFASLLFEPIV
ncbi:hypothetical protein C2S51_004938 [Perilla frutescens var. frutescens]|nr:hypothetical protein C2S51_004938 [Perilla frutescens var. frutescens]